MSDFLVDRPLGDPLLDEAGRDEVREEAGNELPELESQPAPGTLNLTIAENAARAVLPTPPPPAHPAHPLTGAHSPFTAAALAAGPAGTGSLALLLADILDGLDRGAADWRGPLPPGGPEAVREAVAESGFGRLPVHGADPFQVVGSLGRLLAWGAADPAHPHCAAHLHCPPLAVSVAAETAVAALNQSLDSWDQSPAAGEIEETVVRTLLDAVGYTAATRGSDRGAGVLTSGGTESNLMGLLLARDELLRTRFDADPDLDGLPAAAAQRLRILTSELAHFSIARNAALLGLGERCVVPVATGMDGRMLPEAVAAALDRVEARDEIPLALVATAGTTDHGAVDPLAALAELARSRGMWLHVDAAYGGGLLLGTDAAPQLIGITSADSITLDLHKLGWQPVPAGVFLVKRAATLRTLERRVAYLNALDDEQAGYPSLLGRSLRTTRRADAVKIAAAFSALGREGFQALNDRCLALARYAAGAIRRHPDLELTTEPALTTVLFRYLAPTGAAGRDPGPAADRSADPARYLDQARATDHLNARIRRHLLASGKAVLGRTELPRPRPGTPPGTVRLKLTLLNPHTTESQIDELLAVVCAAGNQVRP